jgi:hypothetical protein
MRLPRVLEMTVFLLVAVVVLLPRPDARVKPALKLDDADDRARVAELQAELLGKPADVDATLELADLLMDGRRPDFALAALEPAIERHPADHRLYARRSLALADHYEGGSAFTAADRAYALCQAGSTAPCGEGERARLGLLRSSLEAIKDFDMRKEPNAVKERLIKGLRPAYIHKNVAAPAGGKAPPAPKTGPKTAPSGASKPAVRP